MTTTIDISLTVSLGQVTITKRGTPSEGSQVLFLGEDSQGADLRFITSKPTFVRIQKTGKNEDREIWICQFYPNHYHHSGHSWEVQTQVLETCCARYTRLSVHSPTPTDSYKN